jgi:hypothetical protein
LTKDKETLDEKSIMHMYMGMSKGNPLQIFLKQAKMSFFKNGEQKGKTGSVWGLVPVGRGRK